MVHPLSPQPGAAPWTRYWATGVLSSLPEVYGDPAEGPLAAVWRRELASLGDRARILDLGCGNGAVALLAARTAAERGVFWELHGVDLAAIDPARAVSGRYRDAVCGVTFHPATPMSATPFAGRYFDLVAGQFAIEYGDPPQVLAEVSRVLRPAGRAAFVVHLRESAVVATARVELAQLQEVLAPGAVLDLAFAVLDSGAGVASARERSSAWSSFAREVIRLDRIGSFQEATWPTGTLRDVPAALRDALTGAVEVGGAARPTRAAACRSELTDLAATLRDRSARLAELVSAAPDRAGLDRMIAAAGRLGLDVSRREDLHDPRGPLIAHAVALGTRGRSGGNGGGRTTPNRCAPAGRRPRSGRRR